MKKIKVFLSSAMTGELDQERNSLRLGFQENQFLHEFYDLFAIEDHASTRGIEEAYTEELEDSDLVIFLFCTEIRTAVLKEFECAIKHNLKFIAYIKDNTKQDTELSVFIKENIYKYNPGSFYNFSDLFDRIKLDLRNDIIRSYTKELNLTKESDPIYVKHPSNGPETSYRYFSLEDLDELSKQKDFSDLTVDQLITLSMIFVDETANYKNALALLELGLLYEPDNWILHNNRGILLDSMGLHEPAVFSYKNALIFNPESDTANYNLGQANFKLTNYEGAISYYKKSLKLMENKLNATSQIAACYIKLGMSKEALEWAKKTYELNKDNTSLINLISANVMSDNLEKANKLLNLLPHDSFQYKDINAFVLYKEGKLDEAIVIIDELYSSGRMKFDSGRTKFSCLIKLSLAKEANEWFTKLEQLFPVSPSVYNNCGYEFIEQFGMHLLAASYFEKALKEEPFLWTAWNNLQYNYALLGEEEKSFEACDRALELNPFDPNSIKNKAQLLMQSGKYTELAQFYMSKTTGVIGLPIDNDQMNNIFQDTFAKNLDALKKVELSMKRLHELQKKINDDA